MDPGPIKIFTARDEPRLRYIADLILHDILGLSWEIVTDKRKLRKNPVINYSSENINGSFKISPDNLLFESGIKNQEIVVSEWKSLPVFFQTTIDSDFPFDIFAASFFLVSRYEEYLEFDPDKFGRYKASSSYSFINGFLRRPIINLWARELSKSLVARFKTMAFKRNTYKALLTIDLDLPFVYLGKNIFRCLGGLFLDIWNKTGKAGERYRCVARGEKDPYDVFDYIIETSEKFNSDVRFFIPVGDRSFHDNNPSWKNEDYRSLIRRLSDKFITGFHPSFVASGNDTLMNTEVLRLKSIIEKDISSGRFHYINIHLPESYRNMIKAGVKEDFSMGYHDEPGFRAGIATPFLFYDVLDDKMTDLRIVPFQIMDGTLYQYQGLDPAASKKIITELIDETRKVGGLFVSIWHNTSLLDRPEWNEWRSLFEFMLKQQQP
jgi:hypothetical protein